MTLRSETKGAFTLSNARLFYSSIRRGSGNTGLTTTTPSQKLCPPLINPLTPRSETLNILQGEMKMKRRGCPSGKLLLEVTSPKV